MRPRLEMRIMEEETTTTEDKKIDVFTARLEHQRMLWNPSDHSCKHRNKTSNVLRGKSPGEVWGADSPLFLLLKIGVTEDILREVDRSWFALVIFRARSRQRSQLPLPGRFLSRRCFTLCITMEVEPRIAKQYKCHYCCVCKNYKER